MAEQNQIPVNGLNNNEWKAEQDGMAFQGRLRVARPKH